MALLAPDKIILKSTTRLSLNERFSAYRKQAEHTAVAVRQRLHQTMQDNSRNWRLIQQMENRPSVIAALKLKKKIFKQRLGQSPRKSVKDRLTLGVIRGGRLGVRTQRFKGGNKPMFGRFNRRGKLRGRISVASLQSRNNQMLGSSWSISESPRLQGRLGRRLGQGNGAGGSNIMSGTTVGARNRQGKGFEYRRGRGGARNIRGAIQGRGQFVSQKFRASPNVGRKRGQVRGGQLRGRGKPNPVPSRQTLDNELDEYMSRTKGNLDMELDSYMAQAQFD